MVQSRICCAYGSTFWPPTSFLRVIVSHFKYSLPLGYPVLSGAMRLKAEIQIVTDLIINIIFFYLFRNVAPVVISVLYVDIFLCESSYFVDTELQFEDCCAYKSCNHTYAQNVSFSERFAVQSPLLACMDLWYHSRSHSRSAFFKECSQPNCYSETLHCNG